MIFTGAAETMGTSLQPGRIRYAADRGKALRASEIRAWRAANPGVLLEIEGGQLGPGSLDLSDLHPLHARNVHFFSIKFHGGPLQPRPHQETLQLPAEFERCVLTDIAFDDTDLGAPTFMECDVHNCRFKRTLANAVEFMRTRLSSCDFSDATFGRAGLVSTVISDCMFRGARFVRGVFGATHIIDSDVSAIEGLAGAVHIVPSTFSIGALQRLSRDLPTEFTRGAGLDPLIVGLFRGTGEQRISAFYEWLDTQCRTRLQSCFISYATPDLQFVTRLQQALNGAGVDYWYAPEHGRWGEELQHQVKREISLRDRMIVVCSKSSLDRDWVRFEIEEALDAEKKRPLTPGRRRLFPIMIDDALVEWRDPIKPRLWNILAGDFRGATEPGPRFDAAVTRLIEGLRTEAPVES